MIRNFVRRRALWSIRVFRTIDLDEALNLTLANCELIHEVKQPLLRSSISFPTTIADPFLFSQVDALYLFYEVETDFSHGEIHVSSMDSAGAWTFHGCVLREPFHLSFPNVFSLGDDIYMIPEASASGGVPLYRAISFPTKWERQQLLIDTPLLDPVLLDAGNYLMLLGTTLEYQLVAYSSKSLTSQFRQVGKAITADRGVSRNGGAPLRLGTNLFRVWQDCRDLYGKSIGLSLITELSESNYSEVIWKSALLSEQEKWMQDGYHGLSAAEFGGQHYLAIDGRRKDLLVNNYLLILHKLMALAKRRF